VRLRARGDHLLRGLRQAVGTDGAHRHQVPP
jgi:hypothetical protein